MTNENPGGFPGAVRPYQRNEYDTWLVASFFVAYNETAQVRCN